MLAKLKRSNPNAFAQEIFYLSYVTCVRIILIIIIPGTYQIYPEGQVNDLY